MATIHYGCDDPHKSFYVFDAAVKARDRSTWCVRRSLCIMRTVAVRVCGGHPDGIGGALVSVNAGDDDTLRALVAQLGDHHLQS